MELIYFVIILVVVIAGFFFLFRMLKPKEQKEDGQGMVLLQQQLMQLTQAVDAKLGESRKEMTESVRHQFSQSQQLLKEISESMNKSLIDVTREQTKPTSKRGSL